MEDRKWNGKKAHRKATTNKKKCRIMFGFRNVYPHGFVEQKVKGLFCAHSETEQRRWQKKRITKTKDDDNKQSAQRWHNCISHVIKCDTILLSSFNRFKMAAIRHNFNYKHFRCNANKYIRGIRVRRNRKTYKWKKIKMALRKREKKNQPNSL